MKTRNCHSIRVILALTLCLVFMVLSCEKQETPIPTPTTPKLKVGVLIDTGTENDKSFNEYTLKGAREASAEADLDFFYLTPQLTGEYGRGLESLAAQNPSLIITVGFQQGDATARAARKYPDIRFVIVDNAYFPGSGCLETVDSCYTEEGGLPNVTSLMFAEDEVGYLAGVLAACMTQTDTVGSVVGMEIPPVVRFVTGFQNGARSIKPDVITLNQYIPDFNDPATGKVVAQSFTNQGADVIFGVAGNTGNGALLAVKEAGLMAIGVDADQYLTYPEVKDVLITSAVKNVDVAAAAAVKDFAAGQLTGGIRMATIANNGVGLAPYHDWEDGIPQACKDQVETAKETIKADPAITGAK